MLGFTTMTAAFTSSIFSAGARVVAAEFGVSSEVGVLGVSFYVLGFAFGPTMWAPLSELSGRRMPLVVSMFGFSIFTIAVGTAKDLQTILICRFFAGFFGACPLAVVAAVFSDMFNNATRGIAITIFSMAVFTGPLLAPFIGGYIVDSYLGWRWTMYITAIMGFVSFGLDLLFLEETYPPQILIAKAAELRRRTGNHFIHAKQEEIEVDLRELLEKNFSRPMRLLFQEPIILLLSIYMSFVYGILYLFLTAYPLVFQGVHGFSAGPSGLCFLGMILGEIIAGVVVLLQQPWYQRKLNANNGVPIPEWRLPSVIAGGVTFCVGIFWVCPSVNFTPSPHITNKHLNSSDGPATAPTSTGLYPPRPVSSPASASCPSSSKPSITSSTPTSCSPPQPSPATPSCAPSPAPASRSLRPTCSTAWASSTPRRCSAASQPCWRPSPSSSGCMGLRFAPRASLHRRRRRRR